MAKVNINIFLSVYFLMEPPQSDVVYSPLQTHLEWSQIYPPLKSASLTRTYPLALYKLINKNNYEVMKCGLLRLQHSKTKK